jgi:anti-sigma B factor antagonist
MTHTTSPTLHGLPGRIAASDPVDDAPDLRTSSAYDGIDRITVHVDGEIDMATVDQLRDALDIAVGKGVRQVIVDLRDVRFLGSDGLNCLARAARCAEAAGCKLYTIATQRVVVRPIEITGFAQALGLRGDPAAVPSPLFDT